MLSVEEEKMFEGQPRGFPFGDFDIADVMLPDGDTMGIPSDDEEEEELIETETGLGHIVVVDNIPQVGAEKYDKLTKILSKIFSASGTIAENGLNHPVDQSTGLSKGFAFVEYENHDQARTARMALDGYQLDKNHKFIAILFDDLERLNDVPDEYQEPPQKPYEPATDLYNWMGDRRGRDQFAVRYGDETEVLFNDVAQQNPQKVKDRSFWTEAPFIQWSPQGTYLATVHMQGVAIWGGDDFRRIRRFSHKNAQRLAFSECEKFVYIYTDIPPEGRQPPRFALSVYEVTTGRKLRVFEGSQEDHAVGAARRPDGGMAYPAFKWSSSTDDGHAFLAVMRKNAISIYQAPEMTLLDKKSIKADGIQSFEWSPADPILCAYQEEQGNLPARVVLIRSPDREEVRAKNLFSVADVRMAWHPQGDYLAVRVEKWTKTKKSTTTNLELFSMREKNIPVDMLELPNKSEKISGLAWEPHGNRFALIHGSDPQRPSVSLYSMKDPKSGALGGVHHIHTVHNRSVSSLHWSPKGRFLLLAGLKQNGKLEWWDTHDEVSVVGAGEHLMATEVAWDPSGRYVVTSVTAVNQMENGYQVWSFCGQPLYKVSKDRFFGFVWRPRPECLLSKEKQKEISKNLKKYSKRFEEEDEKLLAAVDSELLAEREKMLSEWNSWKESRVEWAEKQKEGIKQLLGSKWVAPEEEYIVQEVEVSAIVDVREQKVESQ
ncbi:Eukaryotic translation initiation factor 3 subunit B [Picochlorum sp. SENEW3]|nr:Eukaryotic translation initiation factor 3 subunit B [Picochlorum sp. SENEW3]